MDIVLNPDLFAHIAPHFDVDDWKNFRASCKTAQELMVAFCEEPEMMFRSCNNLHGDPSRHVESFPCPHDNKHRIFYLDALRARLARHAPIERAKLFFRCKHNGLTFDEERYALGNIREFSTALHSNTLDKCYTRMSNDMLRYLAKEKHYYAAVELYTRGQEDWNLYEALGFVTACPKSYSGSHEAFMRNLLKNTKCQRRCIDVCTECCKVILEEQPQLLTEALVYSRCDPAVLANIIKRNGYIMIVRNTLLGMRGLKEKLNKINEIEPNLVRFSDIREFALAIRVESA